MNRIDQLFKQKSSKILSIYMTAGYPGLNDTVNIIKLLQKGGADMIEIGIPFSDPLADGFVIQSSSQKALQNGMSPSLLFDQLSGIRAQVTIPLILMGYLNPVLKYGFENFLKDCRRVGIDGLIIPDLPLDEYEADYEPLCKSYGIHLSMLIAPHTSAERINRIASQSRGFLYMVADSSTTGARSGIKDQQLEYFERVKQMNLDLPRLIGFGISSHETFEKASQYANGAIIGSAFIDALREADNLETAIMNFLNEILTGES